MMISEDNGSFWRSNSGLITSMLFIILVLVIVCLVTVSVSYKCLEKELQMTEQILVETQATNEHLQQVLQLSQQFQELGNGSVLDCDKEKIIPTGSRPDQKKTTKSELVKISETSKLKIYYPEYSKIDLVCKKMPSKSNQNVILTCAAAYTAKRLYSFSHANIIGNHISNGILYSGAKSNAYIGAFAFYNGTAHFAYNDWKREFHDATANGGCGFAQDMMIHNGKITNYRRDKAQVREYRALCQIGEKIAVVDSKGTLRFDVFVDELHKLGVSEAIYLDMGGWKHSWYRDSTGKAIDIYPNPTKYATNWITFYK